MRRAAARLVPAPVVLGFVAMLALLFAVSYVVGGLAGPVAPGMHSSNYDGGTRQGPAMPGMDGM